MNRDGRIIKRCRIFLALSPLWVMGCSLLGPSEEESRQFFSPHATRCEIASLSPALSFDVNGSAFYDTQRIAFSRKPRQRQFYSYSFFTDRPYELLERALNEWSSTRSTRTRNESTVFIDELYHDAQIEPGVLVARGRIAFGSGEPHTFRLSVPASSYDAEGVVEAFEQLPCELLRLVESLQAGYQTNGEGGV